MSEKQIPNKTAHEKLVLTFKDLDERIVIEEPKPAAQALGLPEIDQHLLGAAYKIPETRVSTSEESNKLAVSYQNVQIPDVAPPPQTARSVITDAEMLRTTLAGTPLNNATFDDEPTSSSRNATPGLAKTSPTPHPLLQRLKRWFT